MPDARAIRERLTAMLALSDEDLLRESDVARREPVAVTQFGEGAITSRSIGTTGGSGKRCATSPVLDIVGTSHTGDDGSVEIRITDFYCSSRIYRFQQPLNFIATPQTRTPVYLTTRQRISADADGAEERDVLVTVWSWNSAGSPAPRASSTGASLAISEDIQ